MSKDSTSTDRTQDRRFGPHRDLAGMRFGDLVAIKWVGRGKWFCVCDCGKERSILGYSIVSGNTKSCGCLKRQVLLSRNRKHGMRRTRIYGIWNRMRQRCRDTHSSDYESYGGRGITVCKEWQRFEFFHRWALDNGYSLSLTIDRIDNDGDYAPANCRWVTAAEQAQNKRNSRNITFNGETRILAEWGRLLNMGHSLLRYRIARRGIERAFTTPIRGTQ